MFFEKTSKQNISQLIYRTVIVMLSLGILLTTATDYSFAATLNGSLLQLDDGDVHTWPTPEGKLRKVGDLGDAPDSTNHSGARMSAYPMIFPNIFARYPTVYGVNTPDAPGPKHWSPRSDAWLGRYVSLEYDADLMPDEDQTTNIIPPNNKANLDDFDDGVHLNTVLIPECGQTKFDYDVYVPPSAALGRSERFVNVWFDYNRDGDWEDTLRCENSEGDMIEVTEWSVQNHTITVGSGYHTLTTPDFEAMNPPHDQNPMWMRITLSESEVPMSFQTETEFTDGRGPTDAESTDGRGPAKAEFTDGRGPKDGYRFGETEDYYLNDAPITPDKPDITIHKSADPGTFEAGGTGSYILEVTNIGDSSTTDTTVVTDILPNGIVPTNVTILPSGNCPIGPTVECELPSPIAPNDSYTIIIEVTVTNQADPVVKNCAHAETIDESDYTNNESCVETEVQAEEPEKFIYVSSSTGGTVSGIRFNDEDILEFNTSTGDWAMYFDGSDVGVGGVDVNAFHVLDNGDILMSFNIPVNLGNPVTLYDDSDIAYFAVTSSGTNTAGTFEMYLDGSDFQLTTNREDIDAIGFEPGGDLVISILGDAVIASDEDLIRLDASGDWHLYFDGADVGLNTNDEDIWATWIDETGEIHLSTSRNYNIPGLTPPIGDSDNIFICNPNSLGHNTNCTFSLFWDGDLHDYGMERIDGYSVLKDTSNSNLTSTNRRSVVDEPSQKEDDVEEDDTANDDFLEESAVEIYLPVVNQ